MRSEYFSLPKIFISTLLMGWFFSCNKWWLLSQFLQYHHSIQSLSHNTESRVYRSREGHLSGRSLLPYWTWKSQILCKKKLIPWRASISLIIDKCFYKVNHEERDNFECWDKFHLKRRDLSSIENSYSLNVSF